ncbi:MAG: hypothetical protein K2J59_02970 [Eubacterium sp.]|nr:hypothetical protein [Eubacterium sp.]
MYKILIADDETKIRETIKDYFSAKGFDVVLAANGKEAVELSNAIKHTDNGNTIKIFLKKCDKAYRFSVYNEGKNIPK